MQWPIISSVGSCLSPYQRQEDEGRRRNVQEIPMTFTVFVSLLFFNFIRCFHIFHSLLTFVARHQELYSGYQLFGVLGIR